MQRPGALLRPGSAQSYARSVAEAQSSGGKDERRIVRGLAQYNNIVIDMEIAKERELYDWQFSKLDLLLALRDSLDAAGYE